MTCNLSNNQARPFVKWAGGKGNLLSSLEPLLPKELAIQESVTYVDPFVGGGAMLFHMLNEHKNIKRVIINDVNQNLMECYRRIKESPEAIIEKLEKLQRKYECMGPEARKDFYYKTRKKYNSIRNINLQSAVLFLFLNHTCFNGLYRVNSKGNFNVPQGRSASSKGFLSICNRETLMKAHNSLNSVDIEIMCGDYFQISATKIISDARYSFVYLDPPYMPISVTSYFNQYTKKPFGEDEQKELFAYCNDLHKNGILFMLSNSDCKKQDGTSFFEELYNGYNCRRILARRFINATTTKRAQLSEIVIRNYD